MFIYLACSFMYRELFQYIYYIIYIELQRNTSR